MERDAKWYALQERRCLEAIREAERKHTEQEVAGAAERLAMKPVDRQKRLIEGV